MKNKQPKDMQTQIITVFVSVLLICAVWVSGIKDELPVLCASVVFYAQTAAQSAESRVREEYSETQTTEKTVQTTSAIKVSEDITRTPNDIVEIIKKYTELFAEDKKDGEIKAVTYEKAGATHIFENIRVKNTTDTKPLNIEEIISHKLELSIDKSKPAVLIFHSHTSEGYELIERNWYAVDYIARSNNESLNVVRVGTEIANYLEKSGYTVIHDKTIHDKNYSDSYPNSRKTIEKHLEEHPEIQIVLDIHRDSITQNDGSKIKPLNTVGGKKAAQLMIITGAEEGKVEDFPDWEYNLRFALQLQKKCEDMFPGLMRPVLFSQRKYNMDMTRFSLLIEMGSEANTLEEACYSGRMLGAALAALMDEYVREEQ